MRAGKQVSRRVVTGVLYSAVAVGVLVWLAFNRDLPPFTLLFVFAIPYFWLEVHTVEVNDRLRISSSIMVLLSAGVVFGPDSRAFGMAVLSGFWPFVPADFKERRIFFPLASFGQLVVSGAAAGLTLDLVAPLEVVDGTTLLQTAGAAVLAAVVYSALNTAHIQIIRRVVMKSVQIAPWTDMGNLVLSFTALGAIGGLLGATLIYMESIVLLPVFFVIYLIGQLAFQTYADLREAHESTIRGFIKTLEAKDMFVHGHTARVASFARMIGQELAFSPTRMERLRWAALLHDVGAIAVPRDLLRNRRSLIDEEQAQLLVNTENVESELIQSDFLRPMMERAARLRVDFADSPDDDVTADAQVLAVAKWFDSVTNTRIQGKALTQEAAIAQMRAESPQKYDPRVVEAFAAALEASGFQYGAVEFDSTKTREDYAKEAMYDR